MKHPVLDRESKGTSRGESSWLWARIPHNSGVFLCSLALVLTATFAFAPLLLAAPIDDDEVDELIRDLTLEGKERQAASKAASDTAQKLMDELRYVEAEDKLREAVRLDPENKKARQMLETVLLILGDRTGEIRDFMRDEVERQRVRLQQDTVELERMYLDGRRQMDEGEYDRSINTFDQVLERIRWFPFNVDLSDLRTRAERSKEDAIRIQREDSTAQRREREMRVLAEAEAQMTRSASFLENRVKEMMRRARRLFVEKDYVSVITLCDQVLDLDPSRADVRALRREAADLRHLYEVLETSVRHREEWERTFMAQLESEIPYTKIFNFPKGDDWLLISRKEINLEERILASESAQEKSIKSKLKVRVSRIGFDDRPFSEVIAFLQELSGINFVLTQEARDIVESSVVRLAEVSDLPLENVLNLILEGMDPPFSYIIKSGAVLIGPVESIRPGTYLEFYEVSDITKDHPDFKAPKLALEASGDDGGGGGGGLLDLGGEEDSQETTLDSDILVEIVDNALYGDDGPDDSMGESTKYQNGKLVARTTLENHRKIVQLLIALRKSTGVMVTVEARFIDLQDNFLESIGVDFGNPFNSNLPNTISDIDGAGTQISSGFEIVDAQGEIDVRAAVFNAFSLPLGSSVSPFEMSSRGGFSFQYNVLDTYALEAILEANQKTQEFKRLDAPRVTAFNTQISHSLVVDQSAYIKDAEVNQTGVVPVINPVIGILNSGSILQVRPTVSHDRKYVILEIEPTLAVQLPSRFKTLTLGLTNLNVEFPVLSVTNIKTTVTIPDGGTVLVGGLKRTITQEGQTGVPALSRLPFMDFLFGRTGKARMQSNLFVLISSKITVVQDEERKAFN